MTEATGQEIGTLAAEDPIRGFPADAFGRRPTGENDGSRDSARPSSVRRRRLQSSCQRPSGQTEKQHGAVPLRPGLPPRWQEIAVGVKARTGRELLVQPPEEAVSDGPQSIEVYLDRGLLGQFEVWWDDHDIEEGLSELRGALSVYLDEEFRTDDW